MIYVYNKADKVEPDMLPIVKSDSIYMSAKEKIGLEELICLIEKKLAGSYRECAMLIPYTDGRAVSYLNENAVVHETQYREEGVFMRLNCKAEDYRYYEKYLVK